MIRDFIDDILNALDRIGSPDIVKLKEVLICSGMPKQTENLRYLGFNRLPVPDTTRDRIFSAVAVINNRRITKWALEGYRKKISRIVFSGRWTRNPLDLFINNLRCDSELMEIMASSPGDYTLMGMLRVERIHGAGVLKHKFLTIRPAIAIPGISEEALKKVTSFEARNEIRQARFRGFTIYHKVAR